MDRHDILIYFFFYDDSARIWDTGDRIEAAERDFFEHIVRRFSHHRSLIWIIGEESEERYTSARVQRFFEATDFTTMAPHDELRHAGTTYVLADPGRSYIAYSSNLAGVLGLPRPAGRQLHNHLAGLPQRCHRDRTPSGRSD